MTTNGHIGGAVKLLVAGAGLVGLVYFGVRLGETETRVNTSERLLAEHNARVEAEHHFIEQRTDRKLADQSALILTELRALNQRLDRIERRLP